jgi:pyruvate/2-oxoglutarate dehydrogenase complex dihydrolipoamide dehydrogenase (E3) component
MASGGYATVLVERKHVGGTCVNEGCTPTKTTVASARITHLARRASDYGVSTDPVGVDMAKVRRRNRNVVESFRDGSERLIESAEGLDLLMGEASFTGPRQLEVRVNGGGMLLLTADSIFLNTGIRLSVPPVEGLAHAPCAVKL